MAEIKVFSIDNKMNRDRQEDYAESPRITTKGGLDLQIGLVCDGAGSEQASRLTARTILDSLQANEDPSIPKILIDAVESSNRIVSAELAGAGTSTVALAAVDMNDGPHGRLFIVSAGNSHIYLMRDGKIVRLNIDHTLANELIHAGQATPEAAYRDPNADFITRVIGSGTDFQPDIGFYVERGKNVVNSPRAFKIGQQGMALKEGDTILVATDGLFGSNGKTHVSQDQIKKHALDNDVERAARAFVKYADEGKADDNVALSLMFVPSSRRRFVRSTPLFTRSQIYGGGAVLTIAIFALLFAVFQTVKSDFDRRSAEQQIADFRENYRLTLEALTPQGTTTPTPTLTPTPPLGANVEGQVGYRFYRASPPTDVMPGVWLEPPNPPDVSYISIIGADILLNRGINNPANVYMQPATSARIDAATDGVGSQSAAISVQDEGDVFVNTGDYQNGGVTVNYEGIIFSTSASCFSVKNIKATQLNDHDKLALTCYTGQEGDCKYQLPDKPTAETMPIGRQVMLDMKDNKLVSINPVPFGDVKTYYDTVVLLVGYADQAECLKNSLDPDNDDLAYPQDECPLEAGTANGCPDTDGDSVPNSQDQCPNELGSVLNHGCAGEGLPDYDGDGVDDTVDACPLDPGDPANNGCPLTGPRATDYAATLTATALGIFPTETGTPTETPTPSETPTETPTVTATLPPSPTFTPTVEPPDAVDDTFTTFTDVALIVAAPGVLANDILNDGTLAPFTGKTTKNGSITLNSDGGFTYNPPKAFVGTDNFSYTLTDADGRTDSANVVIKVEEPPIPPPEANFTFSPQCSSDGLVQFTNTSTGAINSYAWDFGDGKTSGILSPSHSYGGGDPKTYNVQLKVSGPGGDGTFSASVKPFPPAPNASGDSTNTNQNQSKTINILGNDSFTGTVTVAISQPAVGGSSTTLNPDKTVTYTPKAGYTGADSFTYTLTDANGCVSGSATVSIDVRPVVDAVNDGPINIIIGGSADIDVQANDTPPTGTGGSSITCGTAANGTVTKVGNNCRYVSNGTATGLDSFQYTLTVGVVSDTATVSINTGPDAVNDDAGATSIGTPLDVNVRANDKPANTGTVACAAIGGTTQGTVTTVGTNCRYTPSSATFTGSDSFQYTLTVGGLTDTATVTVRVDPVAVDDGPFTTNIDTALDNIDVRANDQPANAGTVTIATGPQHGTAVAGTTANTFLYTPDPGYTGVDFFVYTLDTGSGGTDTATVTISVVGAAGPPIARNDAYRVAPGTTPATFSAFNGVLRNDTLNAGAIVSSTTPTGGTLVLNLDGSFTFNPTGVTAGTQVTFTYTLETSPASCAVSCTATVTISVTAAAAPLPIAVNDPSALPATRYTTAFNTDFTVTEATLLTNDTPNGGVIISTTLPANGLLSWGAGSFTYNPNDNFCGNNQFVYTLDNGIGTDAATVKLTVSDPIITASFTATPQVAPSHVVDFNASASTISAGAVINFYDWDFDNNGVFDQTTTTPTVSHDYGSAGNRTVRLRVRGDAVGGSVSNSCQVNDNVTQGVTVNTAGTVLNDAATTNVNQAVSINVLANDKLDRTTIASALRLLVAKAAAYGTVTINPDNTITYTPNNNIVGTDTFTYSADGSTATVTVTILPDAREDGTGTTIGGSVTVNVLGNDLPSSGDVSLAAGAANGSVTKNGDNTFTYKPNAGFAGMDTFRYSLTVNGVSDTATVTISVAPIARNDSASVQAGNKVTFNVLSNDSPNSGSVSVVAGVGHGTLTRNADGTFTYVPAEGFSGTDSFQYTLSVGGVTSSVATVTITVNAPPTQPPPPTDEPPPDSTLVPFPTPTPDD